MNCPRCPGELRPAGPAFLCRGCEGCWFEGDKLEAVLADGEVAGTPLAVTLVADEHGVQLESSVTCPRCARVMYRYEYGDSGVELDACPQHGVWLDDGELGVLLDYAAVRTSEDRQVPKEFWRWLGSWFRKL